MPLTNADLSEYLTACFVETGTGSCGGVRTALATGFAEIRSIEALENIANSARDEFKNYNVSIYHGLSQELLPSILSDFDEPVTIFFDAHYSGPGSYLGNEISPLMHELDAIKKHHVNNHILLIDDTNLFGRPEIPNLNIDDVKRKVLEINPNYTFAYVGSVLVCKAPIQITTPRKIHRLCSKSTDNIYSYLEELLPTLTDGIFFEVGAANGEDTARIRNINSNMTYHAFEPDNRNIEMFKNKNIPNVTLAETAVGSYNGKTIFYMSSGTNPTYGYEHTLSSSIKRPKKHLEVFPWCKFDRIVNANICTLDQYCKSNRIKYIDFLWVDIQGAESDLVKGARRILANTAYVYLEYASTPMYENQYTYEQLVELMGNNFEVVHKFSGDILFRNKNMS